MFFNRGYFKKLLFITNLFNTLLILICCVLNHYYNPIFSTISFLTFFFPILFFLNICFLIYWTIKIDFRLVLSFLVVIFLYYNSFSFYKIGNKSSEKSESFHVMSFNVRLFNHYNWINKDSIPFQINKLFEKEEPDVLSIQEYHEEYQYLLKHYKNKHVYLSGNNVGLSIHTNNKIIKKGLVNFKNPNNKAIYIDIIQNNDTIRVYNAHFESFRVDMKSLKADLVTFKNIISKIKNGYLVQKNQSEILIDHVLKSPYKTILSVDLNNTQHSYVYKEIEKELNDVFNLIGNGFGSTYEFKFMPIRIDYIFISKSISVESFEIIEQKLSDHKPISAFLNI